MKIWLAAACALAASLGATTASGPTQGPDQEPFATEAPMHPGLRHLYEVPMQTFSLTRAEFTELWRRWPAALPSRAAAEAASPEERVRIVAQHYGLSFDPDREHPIPTGFSGRSHPNPKLERWTMNCLMCHSGSVNGVTVNGLGSNALMLDDLFTDIVFAEGRPRSGFDDGVRRIEFGNTIGVTEATLFGELLLAFRAPNLDMLPQRRWTAIGLRNAARIARNPEGLLPLDAPPWWLLRHKSALYYDHSVEKNHRTLMQFTLGDRTMTGATVRGLDDEFREIYDYIETLPAPRYPGPVDHGRAEKGRALFVRHCSSCHGRYDGGEVNYQPRRIKWGVVGTDATYKGALGQSFRDALSKSFLTEDPSGQRYAVELDRIADEGIVAPPLVGIWASAPYLHNGSVPHLDSLLDYEGRLDLLERGAYVWESKSGAYDHVRVGLKARFLNPDQRAKRGDDRRVHNSTRHGMSARGHAFGVHLKWRERRAVLEYLKTL